MHQTQQKSTTAARVARGNPDNQRPPGPVTDGQASDSPAPDQPAEPKQASFAGFYAVVVGMDGEPPDRALFREALAEALADGPDSFTHCGYSVDRSTVHHVALAFYMRTNRAGVYDAGRRPGTRPMTLQAVLAADTHKKPRTMKAALWVMQILRLARHDRPKQRNRPARWSLNVGGLDWPMVRARVKALRAERSVVSPTTPRKPPRGVVGDTTDRSRATYDQGLPLVNAAAEPPRAREPLQEQQQPFQTDPRIEGLIGAIAGRSRALARPFNEAEARLELVRGERTVDDLQRQADELDADCLARPFTDPATRRRVQRNADNIALGIVSRRERAAAAGQPFNEAEARLEAERDEDLHIAQMLTIADEARCNR